MCRTGCNRLVYVPEALHGPGVGMATAEDGTTRRGTNRAVGVGPGETHTFSCESIHYRRTYIRVAGVVHRLTAMLIGKNVDDVWSIFHVAPRYEIPWPSMFFAQLNGSFTNRIGMVSLFRGIVCDVNSRDYSLTAKQASIMLFPCQTTSTST